MTRNDPALCSIALRQPWLPVLVATLLLAGCTSSSRVDREARLYSVAPARIIPGGAGSVLQPATALTPRQFIARVGKLLERERWASARQVVQRWRDVAVETLRAVTPEQLDGPALLFVATECGALDAIRARRAAPAVWRAWSDARSLMLADLHQGQFAQASARSLPVPVGDAWAEADDLQLHGTALLLTDQPGEAAATLTAAAERVATLDTTWHAELCLLLAEAHRRAGDAAAALSAWKQAVILAASGPVACPSLWDRLGRWKPEGTDWPAGVPDRLMERVAGWYMARDEFGPAVTAYAKAESDADGDADRERYRVEQARALASAGHTTPATALLASLMRSDDNGVAARANALLGVIHLQRANVERGRTLLQHAMDLAAGADDVWVPTIMADLGLACLANEDAADGQRWLAKARDGFLLNGDYLQASSCAANELRYLDFVGDSAAAAALREWRANIEMSGPRPEVR